MEQEEIVSNDIGLNDYVDIDKTGSVRTWVKLTNWRTVKRINTAKEEYYAWKADVHAVGDKADLLTICSPPKTLMISHVDFRKKVNKIFDGKSNTETHVIGIKIVGKEGNALKYDVEIV